MTLVVVAPMNARADEAADFLSRARVLLNQARFGEAVRLLERAAGLAGEQRLAARIQLHLGIGHWLQGNRQLARAAFTAALTKDPSLSLDPRRYKPEIVAAFGRARDSLRGWIVVHGRPAGAVVVVDGVSVGRLPRCTRSAAAGEHQVLVQHRQRTFKQRVRLDPGQRVTLAVDLAERLVMTHEKKPPPPPKQAPPRRRLWTWIAAGGAVVATAAGIGIGLSAQADYDEYLTTSDPLRYDALNDRVPTKATAANVAYATAGVLAVGAVVLFLLER